MATLTQSDLDKAPKVNSYQQDLTAKNGTTMGGLMDTNKTMSDMTVQGQLSGLMSQDNPLMKKAATKGMQYASSRGLLNSSIGAGAAQSAQLDYALPIAQADAATAAKFGQMQYGANLDMQNNLFNTNNEMNLQNNASQNTIAQQDNASKNTIAEMTQGNQFKESEMKLDDQLTQSRMDKEADINLEQTALTTTANLQGKYLDAIDFIKTEAQKSINEIEIAEGITPEEKTKMIQNTIDRRNADLTFTSDLYTLMPGWDYNWIDIIEMPDAPSFNEVASDTYKTTGE